MLESEVDWPAAFLQPSTVLLVAHDLLRQSEATLVFLELLRSLMTVLNHLLEETHIAHEVVSQSLLPQDLSPQDCWMTLARLAIHFASFSCVSSAHALARSRSAHDSAGF